MKNWISLVGLLLITQLGWGQELSASKKAVIEAVEEREEDLIRISDEIWALAETALEESQSAALLANYAEDNGMRVERGVAGMPTAFIASYGSGEPVIGILAEFDALPGLSQKTEPTKQVLQAGAAGHGCGHNLFGAGSLGAAVVIKDMIESGELQGTVKLFGTPAEEKYFGKLYFAREGLLDDLDVCLDWHPSAKISANVQSSKALIDFIVEFEGQAAHASSDPWNGRSALDALEFFTMGLNYQREHLRPQARIHYRIMNGGAVVNVVPDYARIWSRVRHSTAEEVRETYTRVQEIARGASIMANVDYKITLVSGLHEVIPNRTGGKTLQANLEALGPLEYSDEEIAFAHGIQAATDKAQTGIDGKVYPLREMAEYPSGGSTDVGDVSWQVPEIRLGVTTAPEDTPWHSWAVVACGGMSIGHKGMIYAAKALAMTMVDLYEDPGLVEAVKAEFRERKGDKKYEAILPDGPPPVPAGISMGDK